MRRQCRTTTAGGCCGKAYGLAGSAIVAVVLQLLLMQEARLRVFVVGKQFIEDQAIGFLALTP
jgi:hypothetical protein